MARSTILRLHRKLHSSLQPALLNQFAEPVLGKGRWFSNTPYSLKTKDGPRADSLNQSAGKRKRSRSGSQGQSIHHIPQGVPKLSDDPKFAALRDSLRQGLLFDDSTGDCRIHPIALRKACTCSQCVDSSDKQKLYSSAQIPSDIRVEAFQKDENGTYNVTWTHDVPGYDTEHVSRFSAEQIKSWIQMPDYERGAFRHLEKALWDKSSFSEQKATITYGFFMSDRQGLADAMRQLWRTGLLFISDVPKDETSVQKMAERIGVLRNTFYGPTWDVRSVPNARNVAYTDRYLGFHMDLLYMNEPPRFQLLHCLENTCTGGESQFADSYKAIDVVASRRDGKEKWATLLNTSVRYEYDNDGRFYFNNWHTILQTLKRVSRNRWINCENPGLLAGVERVHWSPPFESPSPKMPPGTPQVERVKAEALHALAQTLEADKMIVETKFAPGTCAIFENTRVVHARKAFDVNSGDRWLKGAYVDKQDFMNTMRAIADLLPKEELKPYTPNSLSSMGNL